jgi:hypothetical protein
LDSYEVFDSIHKIFGLDKHKEVCDRGKTTTGELHVAYYHGVLPIMVNKLCCMFFGITHHEFSFNQLHDNLLMEQVSTNDPDNVHSSVAILHLFKHFAMISILG